MAGMREAVLGYRRDACGYRVFFSALAAWVLQDGGLVVVVEHAVARREMPILLRHINREQMSVAHMKGQKTDAPQRGGQMETTYMRTILEGTLGQLLHALGDEDFLQTFTTGKCALADAPERGRQGNLTNLVQIVEPPVTDFTHALIHDDGLYLLSPLKKSGLPFRLRNPARMVSTPSASIVHVLLIRLLIIGEVIVNPRPMCLTHLLITGYMVNSAILAERGSGLLEVEWHIGLDALFTDVEHPLIVTDTGISSRLATDSDLLTPLSIPVHRGSGVSQRGKHSMKIYRAKQRLTYNFLVTDGEVERGRLRHDIGVLLKLRIAPEHIAVLAAFALLMASVPQVPHLTHNIIR